MTTNNLLRAVIEGGRVVQRRRVRRAFRALVSGADSTFTIVPARKLAWREFSDKLGPVVDAWVSFGK